MNTSFLTWVFKCYRHTYIIMSTHVDIFIATNTYTYAHIYAHVIHKNTAYKIFQ